MISSSTRWNDAFENGFPTLFLLELVFCEEDGPHQLSNRRLDGHEELLGVGAATQQHILVFRRKRGLQTFSGAKLKKKKKINPERSTVQTYRILLRKSPLVLQVFTFYLRYTLFYQLVLL